MLQVRDERDTATIHYVSACDVFVDMENFISWGI